MPVGTKSLLFGVHQFLWHPLTVFLAWIDLYGWPSWKELICILIHDWGYWGCNDMDGSEGRKHPETAAILANKLLGKEYFKMCLMHSRYYAKEIGGKPSKLCYADKLSIKYEAWWFYLFRAKISGELKEYRKQAAAKGFVSESTPDKSWFAWVQNYLIGVGLGYKNHTVVSKLVR